MMNSFVFTFNHIELVMGSIDTSGTTIDKYRYFPFIFFLADMFALKKCEETGLQL